MTLLLVFAGGAVGAPARFVIDRLVQRRMGPYPWGILAVNVIGSAILGALLGAGAVPRGLAAFAGTGFCGALTTFSAFGAETVRLLEDGDTGAAAGHAVGGLTLGLGAAAGAYAVAAALF